MGGIQGSHPCHTGNKGMADAPRTSGSAPSPTGPFPRMFSLVRCARRHISAHVYPRFYHLAAAMSPSGRKQDVPALTREHLRGGGWC